MHRFDFPELIQTYNFDCGAKALEAVLAYYGVLNMREDLIMKYAETNKEHGTSIANIIKTLDKFGLAYDSRSMTVDDLHNFIQQNIPVMVQLQAWGRNVTDYKDTYENGHWVVAIGYDEEKFIFEDPYKLVRAFLLKDELLERWHDKEGDARFSCHGIAVFGTPKFNRNELIHMD